MVVPAPLECLQDKDDCVRIAAASSLGALALEPEKGIAALAAALEDGKIEVRLNAVGSLERYAWRYDAEAKPGLTALMNAFTNGEGKVREAATNAVQKLAPEILGTNVTGAANQ